ncbi:MAG: hypothetical protein Q8N53_17670, partial [Longimicrobiales bacterium]|nr:hypothetical protein [Longimicrobiales bacterium]
MNQHIQFYQPINNVELGVIEDMVASLWRLRRTWAIETQLHADAIDNQPPGDEVRRLAAAFTILASTPQLATLHRHETRLHNMRQRAMKNIHLLRTTPPSLNQPDFDPPSFDAEPVPDTPPAPETPAPAPEEPDPPDFVYDPTFTPAVFDIPALIPTPGELAPQTPRDEPTLAPAEPAAPATPSTPEDLAPQNPRDEPTLAPAEPAPPEDPEKDEDPDDDEEYDDDEDDPYPS